MVFFFAEEPRPQFQRAMLGFAAGVMTAASVWSLLLPAIEQAAEFGVARLAARRGRDCCWASCFLSALDAAAAPSAAAAGRRISPAGRARC